MDPTDLSDDEAAQLATQIAPHLPTGTHGDRVVLSRRQFAAATAGVLSTGALMALGVDEASAQAAGQQGTQSSPNDMFAYNLDVQNGATFNGTDLSGVGDFDSDSVSTDAISINGEESQTVSGGSISYPGSTRLVVDGGGSDATITDITGGSEGDILLLRYGGSNVTITVDSGPGSTMRLNENSQKTLESPYDLLLLEYWNGGWTELSYSDYLV